MGEPHSGLALSQRKRGEAGAKEREGGERGELGGVRGAFQAEATGPGSGTGSCGGQPQGGRLPWELAGSEAGLPWEVSCPCATRALLKPTGHALTGARGRPVPGTWVCLW